MRNSVLLLTGMILAVITGISVYQLQQHYNKPEDTALVIENRRNPAEDMLGALRPQFTLQDMHGQQRSVQEWDNRVLVINFWATWCPPCREEIPAFIRLQKKYKEQGLQFVGIALQTAEEVREFVVELGMNYPVLVGTVDVIKVAEAYGNHIGALPYTVIIDRQQRVSYVKQGPLHYDEAETAILAAM